MTVVQEAASNTVVVQDEDDSVDSVSISGLVVKKSPVKFIVGDHVCFFGNELWKFKILVSVFVDVIVIEIFYFRVL